jgi:hypothetical protein
MQISLQRILMALFGNVRGFRRSGKGRNFFRIFFGFACQDFRLVIGQQPVRQTAGETATRICPGRQSTGWTRRGRLEIRLAFLRLIA